MHSAIVPVPARRHPHQVLVAALLLVSGAAILLGGPQPGSINETLPGPLVYLWASVITAGGAMVVAAAAAGPLTALYLELVADLPLSVMCGVYAAAVVTVAGWRGAVPVALVLAAALAFAIRARQVWRTFRQLHSKQRRHASG